MEFAEHCSLYSILPLEYPRATLNANKTITPPWHFAQRETIRGPIQFVANTVSKISPLKIKILSICLKEGSNLQHSSGVCSLTGLGNSFRKYNLVLKCPRSKFYIHSLCPKFYYLSQQVHLVIPKSTSSCTNNLRKRNVSLFPRHSGKGDPFPALSDQMVQASL